MNLAYHDARYVDLYEETMYNALLGSIDLEGKNFYYDNPLDERVPRYPWHVCPCCVGNIPRTLLMLPTWMYAKSADGVYVNLFVGSTITVENVAGTDVEMVQETDYPWNGKVSITVNPKASKRFSVRIRVPNRGVSALYRPAPDVSGIAAIAVNGSAVKASIERGYAVITRAWKAGDRIDFELPLKPQRMHASDKIEATRGKVALRYGPLIYNIEQVDQDITKSLAPGSPLDDRMAEGSAWRRHGDQGQVHRRHSDAGDPQLRPHEPASGPSLSALAPPPGPDGRRPEPPPPASIVWIKEG